DRGILRSPPPPGGAPPARDRALLVFAQRADACVDAAAWGRQADRFFATQLGLSVAKRYDPSVPAPLVDAARAVIHSDRIRGPRRERRVSAIVVRMRTSLVVLVGLCAIPLVACKESKSDPATAAAEAAASAQTAAATASAPSPSPSPAAAGTGTHPSVAHAAP